MSCKGSMIQMLLWESSCICQAMLRGSGPGDLQALDTKQFSAIKGVMSVYLLEGLCRQGRGRAQLGTEMVRKSLTCTHEYLPVSPLHNSLCPALSALRGTRETAHLSQVDWGQASRHPTQTTSHSACNRNPALHGMKLHVHF